VIATWFDDFKPSANSTDIPEPPECKCRDVTFSTTLKREEFTIENRAERRKRAAMKRRGKEPKS